ncbi:Conserved_hypothetical protein [Hexamita inflata]|uniref:Nudix hydrolase domain-containing protein n=1 Tax=Hexamita inflata TaxID=28002 RepID=A0ABP1H8W5_9EUKA
MRQRIRAAGVLLYAVDSDQKIWVLLRTTADKGYSDFGGRRNSVDHTPLDTAIRKCVSESHQIFVEEQLRNAIDPNCYDHIKESSYYLYYAKIDKIDVNEMQSRDVEMQECHEYKWFPQDYDFIINQEDIKNPNPQSIHCRMSNIKNYIKRIQEKEHK